MRKKDSQTTTQGTWNHCYTKEVLQMDRYTLYKQNAAKQTFSKKFFLYTEYNLVIQTGDTANTEKDTWT